MGTRVLKRPRRGGTFALIVAAGLAAVLGTAGLSNATSAEDPALSCTLTPPARIVVDKPFLQFSPTRSCTAGAPSKVTWVASVGNTLTTDAWFLQRSTALSDVYSNDPMGTWTWKVTDPVDRPDVAFNQPTTDVRFKSAVTGTGVWDAVTGTTTITFHVTRYDAATNKMVPWAGAAGTTWFHESPFRGDPPFTQGATYTTNTNGDVVIKSTPARFDLVFRIEMADAAVTFGSTSNLVLARAGRVIGTR
ncbi:hypothetical protein GCM10009804_15230 [Kribbella hippodromi]|uniref:Uncharacterized protein n=1 Tax=Kribbella hippodromi TaxID=434347 RepID=A0ABN2CKX8_9ACTN